MWVQKAYWVVSSLKQTAFLHPFPPLLSSPLLFDLFMSLIYISILPVPPTILPPLCSSSSLRGPLLRAVWCHPLPGVARLLQRLPELWVGHWGRAGKLHQDQLWQVCMTVLQQLNRGNTHSHKDTDKNWDVRISTYCTACENILNTDLHIYTHTHNTFEFVHILYMCTYTEGVALALEALVRNRKSEEVERSPGPSFQKCWKPRVILYFAYWLPLTSLESCSKKKKIVLL